MTPDRPAVAYCVDSSTPDYVDMMLVSVHSLCSVSPEDTEIRIFFPPGEKVPDDALDRLRRIKSAFPGCSMQVANIMQRYELPLKACGPLSALGWMTFARFVLPFVMNDAMCLYVDCDTLFLKDPFPVLRSYYRLSRESEPVAGVRDALSYIGRGKTPDMECPGYVNGGVLLMDLEEWVKEDLPQKCVFDCLVHRWYFNDQDCVNHLLRPGSLDHRLNVIATWWNCNLGVDAYNRRHGTSYGSLSEAAGDAIVLHYTGRPTKPLQYMDGRKRYDPKYADLMEPYERAYRAYRETTG